MPNMNNTQKLIDSYLSWSLKLHRASVRMSKEGKDGTRLAYLAQRAADKAKLLAA